MLGGTSVVARYTGWPTSTVDSWINANHIPDWRRPALLRMALDTGKSLSTDDFPAKVARAA
jgi:hypothetical protein